MQTCTRMCVKIKSPYSLSAAFCVAIVLLVHSPHSMAIEPVPAQSTRSLDQNQDPGHRSARAVSVVAPQLSGLIDINNATIEELALALPGIGPGKAQRIVDWRNDNGSFQFLDQLLEVNGIGPKTLERIAPFIHFGEAGESVSRYTPAGRDPHHRWVLLDIISQANKDAQRVLAKPADS